MNSAFWRSMREQIARGQPDEALSQIKANWNSSADRDPEAADCVAAAIARKGDLAGALRPLNDLVATGAANFHTYYRLAEYHRALGQIDHTFRNFRLAHAQADWPQSLAHGYTFTHDYFSPAIPRWQKWFREIIMTSPIEVLEIGSWQGGSATWLLDNIVSSRGGRLTCIDAFEGSSEHVGMIDKLGDTLENIFDENIKRTGHGNQLRKLVGYSQLVLPKLWGEKFDLIYIDGAHEAKFVIQDAVLCWGLLRNGGFMLFDDLNFSFANHPEQDTNRAIDFFLSVFADDLEVVERSSQLLLRRIK